MKCTSALETGLHFQFEIIILLIVEFVVVVVSHHFLFFNKKKKASHQNHFLFIVFVRGSTMVLPVCS
jgi:hypothetical protein